jgi:hypothetical protein
MTVIVYTIVGEKLTMRNTTEEEAFEFLSEHGVREDHIFKVEVTE